MFTRLSFCIEPLEARIAPAAINNPLPDIVAGSGKTGATVDLSKLTAPASAAANHTFVDFVTNFDTDTTVPGIQNGIIHIELFDDTAPLTVQNFLAYVTIKNPKLDYDGTIIHRSAEFGSGSGTGNDIIQGGGYQVPGFSHIPVGAPVHNEYGAANTAYTIAMAKVGGDPNSATSEWFFNKNDNSSILNTANNGGFTVFGKVTDATSRAVIDGIAALSKQSIGAFSDLPLQNYNADPDNNPSTPAPAPTLDQVIRILDAKVLPQAPVSTTGLTFAVQSIFNAGTTTPSDLLTAAVSGSKLNLNYTKGKSGLADVTVKVNDGTTSTTDTFRVDVRPNLIAKIDKDGFPGEIVPGDAATVNFHVTNNGAAVAGGLVDLKISLAKTNSDGSLPASPTLIPLTTLTDVKLNLAGGASQLFAPKVQIPATLAPDSSAGYRVIVEVDPKTGSAAAERFSDDNVALNAGRHELTNMFGSFTGALGGSRISAVLKQSATDTAGHPTVVTWSIKGAGFGTLTPDGKTLTVSNTTVNSSITATVPKGSAHVKLNEIDVPAAIGTVALGSINLGGPLIASNGLKSLTLGDLAGQSLILIGSVPTDPTSTASIALGTVKDFSLQSDKPITSLTANAWYDTVGTAADQITAPSLGSLRIAGDFSADVTLADDAPTSVIAIKGFMRGSTFQTAGNIGAVTVGGISSSNIFAGVKARPTSLAAFADPHSITSFTVTGITGYSGFLFGGSQIAAATIGTIKVQGINPTTPVADFGFVADVINSYSRGGGPTKVKLTSTAQPFDPIGNYSVRVF